MYRGRRVVAMTPFGREESVSILARYLERSHDEGVLDQWLLFQNTDQHQDSDRAYAQRLADEHPWIVVLRRPGMKGWEKDWHRLFPDSAPPKIPEHWYAGPVQGVKQASTGRFYPYTVDPGAIYLRFDDDIVYVHRSAIIRLCDGAIDHPDRLAHFATIIHNAIVSHCLQEEERIPREWGTVSRHCVDPVGWSSADFAVRLHRAFLETAFQGCDSVDERWILKADVKLGWREQFSVSCFAIAGYEYAQLKGFLTYDEEEHWLTMHHTGIVQRSNWIRRDAVVAHLSFFPHRQQVIDAGILEAYRHLADVECGGATGEMPEIETGHGPVVAEAMTVAEMDAAGARYYESLGETA
jgi:hypothetical protein